MLVFAKCGTDDKCGLKSESTLAAVWPIAKSVRNLQILEERTTIKRSLRERYSLYCNHFMVRFITYSSSKLRSNYLGIKVIRTRTA